MVKYNGTSTLKTLDHFNEDIFLFFVLKVDIQTSFKNLLFCNKSKFGFLQTRVCLGKNTVCVGSREGERDKERERERERAGKVFCNCKGWLQ